ASTRGGRDRRRALQRPGALPAPGDLRPPGPDRHRGQVPGTAGGRGLLLDGELERRRRAARARLSLLEPPVERRDLPREVPCLPRRQPAPARRELQDDRADAPRERALPVRRTRPLRTRLSVSASCATETAGIMDSCPTARRRS